MAARRFGLGAVRGFPPARTAAERGDPALLGLLGGPHDEQAEPGCCGCALCAFNRGGKACGECAEGGEGGAPTLMIADAKECGEGVSFLGARRLLLGDVPSSAEELTQRVGRAVRFMGHPNPNPTLTLTLKM